MQGLNALEVLIRNNFDLVFDNHVDITFVNTKIVDVKIHQQLGKDKTQPFKYTDFFFVLIRSLFDMFECNQSNSDVN
jgi:hypothetical protein